MSEAQDSRLSHAIGLSDEQLNGLKAREKLEEIKSDDEETSK